MYVYWIILTIISFILTHLLKQYALRNNVLDIPNNRSSHVKPTPRGGGMAIVICFLGFQIFLYFNGNIELNIFMSLFASGALIAFVGFLDDHNDLSAKIRILAHILAATIIVFSIGDLFNIKLFDFEVNIGWLGNLVAIVFLVWSLNLYNFMDGIDGLAGSEAVISSSIMSIILFYFYGDENLALLCGGLAAASMGFLIWNWPPAKIFMGDAGSGFLGLMLASLILLSMKIDQQLFWSWATLLGVFVVDSTYTLIKRALAGAQIFKPHRSHAYQHASQKYNSHKIVTLSVIAIDLIWLAPISYAIVVGYLDGFLGLIIAYIPLVVLVKIFRAGEV